MTDYFEVLERDAAARLGELRLDEPYRTPALADPIIEDAGSLWTADRPVPEGRPDRVTVLPHRGFPRGTDAAVESAFVPDAQEVEYPSAVAVSPRTAESLEADVYILSTASGIDGHASAFRDAVVALRDAIPDDTAVYLPGIATPANVSLLAYAGVDLVDTHRAVIEGTRGRYLTATGERFLEDIEEYPCPCPTCRSASGSLTREQCAEHNVNVLESALVEVRERIREGRLREYVEGQVRHDPWLTAALREFDQHWRYLEERTPLYRTARLEATTSDVLHRVEIQRFADRVTGRYRCRFSSPLVLVPCSATKPYSESQSHGQFHRAIRFRGHVVSMTSPIGVVPQELELTYPAQHYDTAVSGRWSDDEIGFVSRVLGRYLERTEYPRLIAHVPEEGYRDICERVSDAVDVEFVYTVEDHPTTDASLENLRTELEGELKYGKRERQENTLKAIADYQFGDGAGDAFLSDISIQSRYPKLRAHERDGTQLAAMVPQYGTLALTLAGARRWLASDVATKRVEIDDFVPHGTVLAPGVVEADASIRVGDEVVVEGPASFAVGRATMHGVAMCESSRGVAVDVRHVEERS